MSSFFFFFTSLAEAEGAAEALAGLDDGLVQAGDLLVDEPTTVPESANGAKEGEEDEEEEEGLRLGCPSPGSAGQGYLSQ